MKEQLTDEQREQIARDYVNRKRRERYAAHPDRERMTRIRTSIKFLIRENVLVPEIRDGQTVYTLNEEGVTA